MPSNQVTTPASVKIRQARSLVNSGMSAANARRNVRGMTTDNMRTNSMVQSGQLPASQAEIYPQTTGFKVDMPSTIPSEALNGQYSMSDVMAQRDNMAQTDAAKTQWNSDFNALLERINGATTQVSPLSDPNAFINNFLLNRPTETQTNIDTTYGELKKATTDFATSYEQSATDARDQFGLSNLQSELAKTREQIAARQVKLRETLRDFETNADRRGVARAFVEDAKAKVQADATAELADLAIVELAQLGNVTEAKTSINELLADKKQAFEFEEKAILNEIARLTQLNTQEAEKRASQLTVALAEKKKRDDQILSDEKETRGYLVDAAANGADQGTLMAIRNAKTPQEAAFLASPFIGKIDRLQAQASIRASNASAALNEAELTAFNKAQEDAANGILSPEQMGTANDINKEFASEPIVKAYNEGLQKYIVLEDTLANGIDGIQDLQLVYDFMKAVDPTSVVRETEFDNAAKTGNIFQGAYARFNKTFGTGGFLPEEVKQDFIRAARMSFEAKNSQYFNLKSEFAKMMNNTLGINNGADYLTAYEGAAPLTQADMGLAELLSGATPQDINDIMGMTQGLMGVQTFK